MTDDEVIRDDAEDAVYNCLKGLIHGPSEVVVDAAIQAVKDFAIDYDIALPVCEHKMGMAQIYRFMLEMGPNHPQAYVHTINEVMARLKFPWFCRAKRCTNLNRYTSGYCGIHDIEFNEGKGERR